MAGKNHYELLGIGRDASKRDIKKAYREIALVYHPDSNFFDEIIDDQMSSMQLDKFKQITDAYNTLINPSKREAYDHSLAPELPGWRSHSEPGPNDLTKSKRGPMGGTSGVYGTFGKVEKEQPRSFARSTFEDEQLMNELRSVKDIIRPSGSGLGGLLRRLFGGRL